MTSTALQDASKHAHLKRAWNWISSGKLGRASANRRGNDGHSLLTFSQRLDSQLSVLSSEVQKGAFKFSPLDPFFIPKTDGKFRVICVPAVGDRVVQRTLLDVIGGKQRWQVNSINYGFISDRGVKKAVGRAVEYRQRQPWAFKTDITKFFDNVDRELLRERILKYVRQKSIHPLLFGAVDCEILPSKPSHVDRLKRLGIIEGRGVRQGMPLSPFFANLFLCEFDRACEKRGVRVLRYADDLIFFADSKTHAEEHEHFCRDELSKIDLQIPGLVAGAKSQIYEPDQTAEFLGVELAATGKGAYEVQLGQNQFDSIKNTIYGLGSLAELKRRGLDITRFGNSLAARVAAYSSAYEFCANRDHLNTCLADWAKATRRRVAQALGINVATLSPDGIWFLQLQD